MAQPIPPNLEAMFGDLFAQFFGKGPTDDVRVTLDLSPDEAARGTTKTIAFTRFTPCERCAGSGTATPGATRVPCTSCAGTGATDLASGMIRMRTPCARCRGAGGTFANPCGGCVGAGTCGVPATLDVRVPAGVDSGQQLRLPNAGSLRAGGPASHVYIMLRVAAAELPAARIERVGGVRPKLHGRMIAAIAGAVAVAWLTYAIVAIWR